MAQRNAALDLLCDGGTIQDVAEKLGVHETIIHEAQLSGGWEEAIEIARKHRIQAAATRADGRQAEWEEHDRQEKDAATALQTMAIQLIPKRQADAAQMDRGSLIRELKLISETLLNSQRARRIASGRAADKTEIETGDGDFLTKWRTAAREVLSGVGSPDDSSPVGADAAPGTGPDSAQ